MAGFDEATEDICTNTRGSEPTRLRWKKGDTGYVTLGGQEYAFTLLDLAFSSEGDYLQTKLELSKTVSGLDGKERSQTWIHPRPVQSYKLRKGLKRARKQRDLAGE